MSHLVQMVYGGEEGVASVLLALTAMSSAKTWASGCWTNVSQRSTL